VCVCVCFTTSISIFAYPGILEKVKVDKQWLSSDEYLKPVMKDDAYLHSVDTLIPEEDWSDDSDNDESESNVAAAAASSQVGNSLSSPAEVELSKVKKQLADTQAQLALLAQTVFKQKFDPETSSLNLHAPKLVTSAQSGGFDPNTLLDSNVIQFFEDSLMNNRKLFEV
jgi:hypothetical protein